MRHQLPQYIDIEDKLIFGLTLKQFLYLTLPVIAFVYLKAVRKWPVGKIIVVELLLAPYAYFSAFVQINGQKFNTVLFNAINYYLKRRLYLWKKIPRFKIFPEVDISLFHKKVEQEITTKDIESKIIKISKKLESTS